MGTGDGDAGSDAAIDAGDILEDSGTEPDEDAGGEQDAGQTLYAVGGTITGLASGASVTLQNNAGDDLSVAENGSFTFATSLATEESYAVTVLAQPSTPHQTCTVTDGTGTIAAEPVTSVTVTCVTHSFFVGGTVSGLTESMILQNNAGDDLTITDNGSFVFPTAVDSGSNYAVTILSGGQGCSVSGGTGTVVAGDVSSVTINCAAGTYTVGGTVSGLTGSGLVATNDGGDEIVLTANGSFAFATPLDNGDEYDVEILAQPAGQTCTVTNGTGNVTGANVTNVAIACATNTYSIGGSLLGLPDGATIVLQNNGGDNLSLTASGAFAFATKVAYGASYNVTILTQPAGQACSVSGGTGSNISGDVTSVVVNCAANTFTVGGTISGLTGKVMLRNNGGDNLELNANGSFAFSQPLMSGAEYDVTVHVQPNGQTCTVTNGQGVVGSANVTSVTVTCATKTYTLGGTITDLTGTVQLANNGGDLLTRNENGEFTFNGLVASGSVYNVTVKKQPVGQKCNVTNGVGVVGEANIDNITVTCVSGLYSIGGTVNGLAADKVVLQNNGGDDLELSKNGPYTFATPLPTSATYSVTVKTPPPGKKCTVSNGEGEVSTMNVFNVVVSCSLDLTL